MGPRFGATVTEFRGRREDAYEVIVADAAQHVVTLRLSGTTKSEVTADGRAQTVVIRPRDLVMMPAGMGRRWIVPAVGQATLHLHLAPAWLADLAETIGAGNTRSMPPHRVGFADRRLAALLAELAERPAEDALAIEQAALACAAEVLRIAGGGGAWVARTHALSPAALRRATTHVEERLGEEITLGGMAAAARLSPFHFARAFRVETGLTPRGYVMRRRCERAKGLLAEGRLALAEIALACGFAHQSHFTNAFRRETGQSPGAWRRVSRA
jgi:AraC family transcriptional regulator